MCCLLFLTALAPPASGQTVVPRDTTRRAADTTRSAADTTARSGDDSLRAAPGDTARPARPDSAPRTPADSARRDSTARTSADTARAAAGDSTQRSAPAAAPAASDSILAAACADGGSLAANLLVVLFMPTVSDSERGALAKAVGGTLAGPADAVRAGGYYLHVPNGDLDPTVADRVIRYPTVQEVGPVSCPSR